MQESFANSTITGRFLQDLAAPFTSRHSLALLAALSIFAGLVGPFGTYGDFPLATRLFYWTVMVAGTASVGHVSATSLERLLKKTGWPLYLEQAVMSVLVAIPVCLVVATISTGLGFGNFVGSMPSLYLQCAAVTGFVVILFNLLPAEPAEKASGLKSEKPVLLERLPLARRGRILRLMAQDHYVEVITDKGRTLIPMRFKDAIVEAGPEPGLQVHRSHWVALHAVTGRCRSEKKSGLRISDGSFVPVGRSFVAAVKKSVPR
ncbi:LytTR family DNA-binding domain-containing protein [Roseibium sp. SCPC15]|uniref:LytTR family DNA-binding domain-containing protein n=1 Tax=Roseibium sp. SCP15 TaxID=3141376 RepID=UPI0033356304